MPTKSKKKPVIITGFFHWYSPYSRGIEFIGGV